jgi:autotransporter-associated beta strand protein
LTAPSTVDTAGFDVTLGGIVSGPSSAVWNKVGAGTLTLTGANTVAGGTTISAGTLSVTQNAAVGSGPVTVASPATLNYASTTATARSYNLNGGTLAAGLGVVVTLNGGTVAAGVLDGSGTFATGPASGARLVNMTTTPSVTITSNSPADQFTHITSGGTFSIADGLNTNGVGTAILLNGFLNQGLGSVTVGRRVRSTSRTSSPPGH